MYILIFQYCFSRSWQKQSVFSSVRAVSYRVFLTCFLSCIKTQESNSLVFKRFYVIVYEFGFACAHLYILVCPRTFMKLNMFVLFSGGSGRCGWAMCPVWSTGVSCLAVEWWTFVWDELLLHLRNTMDVSVRNHSILWHVSRHFLRFKRTLSQLREKSAGISFVNVLLCAER